MRLDKVSGYHLDDKPRPDSPLRSFPAPGARIPPRRILFLTITASAVLRSERCCVDSSKSPEITADSRSNSRMRLARVGPEREKMHLQTAATSGSNSHRCAASQKPSETASNEADAPPANGSIKSGIGLCKLPNHVLKIGVNHVFPPGYRKGLRCGNLEIFMAICMDDTLVRAATTISA